MVNPSCASGRSTLAMSAIFTIQVLAQYALSRSRDEYLVRVRVLPKLRNDEVARLQLDKLGVKFAKLTA